MNLRRLTRLALLSATLAAASSPALAQANTTQQSVLSLLR